MKPSCNCQNCELKELFMDNLQGEAFDIVCSGKVEKEYARSDIIIKEGTPVRDFLYLKSGLVKLYKQYPGGQEQIITIAGPMDYVTLLSVFSMDTYNYSVSALEDSVTCSLQMSDIQHLVSTNGNLGLSLIRKMSRSADRIILDSLEVRRKNSRGKVAQLLIYFSEQVYHSLEFDLPLTRKEMAEFVGMTTENVIRSLSEFRKDGILKIYGKTILIRSMDTLRTIAEFG